MQNIYVDNFMGAVKLIDPRLIEAQIATEAVNCELESGKLNGIKSPYLVKDLDIDTGSVYFHNGVPYEFPGSCDIVPSPVKDSAGRMYLTDGIKPKKTNNEIHPILKPLGIPAPTTPLTVTGEHLDGNSAIATVSYYYTFVTDWGEESIPSPATAVFEIYDTMSVDISGFEIPTVDNVTITKKRLYRLAAGTQGAEYQFVEELDHSVQEYTDTKLTANLGEVCPTEKWISPPDDLRGLIYIGNGFMAGFRSNEVYITEPYLPYVWPLQNMFSATANIVGLGHFGQTLVVCTDSNPVLIHGLDPRAMAQENYPESFPCLSKDSIASMIDCVVFSSSRGLVICNSSGLALLTGAIWSEDDWKNINPTQVIGRIYKGRYYGFIRGTKKGFVVDFRSFMSGDKYPTEVDIDLDGVIEGDISGVSIDKKNDKLYLITTDSTAGNKKLYEYGKLDTRLSYTWKSKLFINQKPCNCGAAMVKQDGQSAFVYDDGQATEYNITSDSTFRLKSGRKSTKRQFSISGNSQVNSIAIGENMRNLLSE